MYMSVFPIDNTLLGKLSLTLFGALANLAPGKGWCGKLDLAQTGPGRLDKVTNMGVNLPGSNLPETR